MTAGPETIDVETVSVAQAGEETFVATDGHLLDAFSLPEATAVQPRESRLLILASLLGAAVAVYLLLRALN